MYRRILYLFLTFSLYSCEAQITWVTTSTPTTPEPTTAAPTTAEPTTVPTTSAAPTTLEPTTAAPTTPEPTTAAPTTYEPTTAAPTTPEPTTDAPTTYEPTTAAPTTPEPTTEAPTTRGRPQYSVSVADSNVPSIEYEVDAVGALQFALETQNSWYEALVYFMQIFSARRDSQKWKLSSGCSYLFLPNSSTYIELKEAYTDTIVTVFE